MYRPFWLQSLVIALGVLSIPSLPIAQPLFEEAHGIPSMPPARGGGIGDINGDGWPDWVGNRSRNGRLRTVVFYNDGNGWGVERPESIVLRDEGLNRERTGFGGGRIVADFDNDGDADVYASVGLFTVDRAERNRLLRNDDGQLHHVPAQEALLDSLPTDNAIWLDYDRDGMLDIYTGNLGFSSSRAPDNPETRNKLYRGLGDGTFIDVTAAAGLNVQLNDRAGGSNGGMAAADFDGDGWPDLYIGVHDGRNRLFRNNQDGTFVDMTTDEIGDEGEAFGVALADFDGNGQTDLFQSSGGLSNSGFRSKMLCNVGGTLIDVTSAVGLTGLTESILGAAAGDIDNDGDADLVIGLPFAVFLNDGRGSFTDVTDTFLSSETAQIEAQQVVLVDWNADGYLDAIMGPQHNSPQRLMLNRGNDNHWLRVDPVGMRSNRDGIGARIIVEAGGRRQVQQLLGGRGYAQDEKVAHFGLGQAGAVDRLEIHWPSGEIDQIDDVAVDQVIRVVEGSGRVFSVHPTRMQLPTSLLAGQQADFHLSVTPTLPTPDSRVIAAYADLSSIGGPARIPLTPTADGSYGARIEDLPATEVSGMHPISLHIQQESPLGPSNFHSYRDVPVLPAQDFSLFHDSTVSPTVQEEVRGGAEAVSFPADAPAYPGHPVARFQVTPSGFTGWSVSFTFDEPIDPFGFESVRFAFRPEASLGGLSLFVRPGLVAVQLAGPQATDPQVVLDADEWQEVTIPIGSSRPIERLTINGNLEGAFYIAGLRLETVAESQTGTAVTEVMSNAQPAQHRLGQNYPNPFNPETTIPFDIEQGGDMELTVFDMAGQRVATLVQGHRASGSYRVRWDATSDSGAPLASGVYFVRLRAGGTTMNRKMLLLH